MTDSHKHPDWTTSVIAFGHPSDPQTFSGYSKNLCDALRDGSCLRREYSAKCISAWDLFRGAVGFDGRTRPAKLVLRRAWIWSRRGSDLLSQRVCRAVGQAADYGNFLQIGTLVQLEPAFGPHFVFTDMTIAQARRANRFAVAALSPRQLDEAEKIQQEVLAGAKHVFTLSDWARDSIVDDCGIPAHKVTTIYIGPCMTVPKDVDVERSSNQILFVGRDWHRKGGPEMIEGFKLLRRSIHEARLVIVGCEPNVNVDGVYIEGFLDPGKPADARRLAELYSGSSCFCLMSDFEPLGNVMIEAYSFGLPVVAYNRGSRPEVVRDGVTGVLCDDREPATIANAFLRMLGDEDTRRVMSEEALRVARQRFTWASVLDRMDRAMTAGC